MLLVEHEDECSPEVYRLGTTEAYSHNPDQECDLGDLSIDDEAGEVMPLDRRRITRVVKARAF
jgi:hypothetical protein